MSFERPIAPDTKTEKEINNRLVAVELAKAVVTLSTISA